MDATLKVTPKVTLNFSSAHIKDGLFVGEVEAVDPSTNTYRIRFDRPGLGTHTVPDYNVLVRPYVQFTTLTFAVLF
jgi:hypothetical protein